MENPMKNGWFAGTTIFGNIHRDAIKPNIPTGVFAELHLRDLDVSAGSAEVLTAAPEVQLMRSRLATVTGNGQELCILEPRRCIQSRWVANSKYVFCWIVHPRKLGEDEANLNEMQIFFQMGWWKTTTRYRSLNKGQPNEVYWGIFLGLGRRIMCCGWLVSESP